MLFQAYGARYDGRSAVAYFWRRGKKQDAEQLKQLLELRYGGEVILYRKGRAALAEAVRIATGGTGAVLVSGLTCYSVPQAVEAAGCTVRYVDIEQDLLQPSAKQLADAYAKTPDVKAIVVQNMLGIPADMSAIEAFAQKHQLVIIEDLAHSAGARYDDGHEVGTVGDITMLSFGRDKAIDAVNGGALIVRNSKYQGTATHPDVRPRFRDQLRDRLYPSVAVLTRTLYRSGLGVYVMAAAIRSRLVVRSADGPVNVRERLPYFQARTALLQLASLDETIKQKQALAALYRELLPYISPALERTGASLARVPLLVANRDHVVYLLRKRGIYVHDIWYDVPVSPQRFYEKAHYDASQFPVSAEVAASLMNFPTHRNVSRDDIEAIAQVLHQARELQ